MLANIHMPASHWLETWGDAEPQKGLFSIIQPMIELPWQVRPFESALIAFATASGSDQFIREIPHAIDATDEVKATPMTKRAATMYEYTRETWRGMHKEYAVVGAFEDFWDSVLRLGVFDRGGRSSSRGAPGQACLSFRCEARNRCAEHGQRHQRSPASLDRTR
jgi:anaerobic selenocysteine-containing dehydrogenase